ncbi:FecR domain-containing protein [Butyricimonas hominis]|uniref:DUF4974 domain-containing protein n=1 Tax=Butyricimonas hominis TaxID=2763032 RepID=A0ABR7D4V8_9BACT|nr:FecR domain-containing protein [Butyricimonas hominis]MBC5622961.1 DUF4974 domain-containing protein [Butyricimonas hominis]
MQKIDWHILRKSITGGMTDEEKSELQGWLEESGENRRYYRKMQGFFTRAGHGGEVDVLKNFREFERKTFGKRRRLVVGILKYAAVFVVLVGSVVLWRGMNFDSQKTNMQQFAFAPGVEKAILYTGTGEQIVLESQVRRNIVVADSFQVRQDSNVLNYAAMKIEGKLIDVTHMIRVPRGGEFSMKLSDATMVYLNAETDLSYPVQFYGEERRVKLTGEAYFDVTKSDKPFVVEVNGFEVKVLGTRFNIHAYQEETRFETTLEQGRVQVQTKDHTLLLEPGEQAVLTEEGELSKQKVDVRRYTAWKDGQFVFDDERLEDVMNRVARWYDIKVFYRNPEVKDIRINGNISRYKDFSVLLEKIEKLEIVYFDIKGNVITVIGK